jgi:hypothetical protein
MTPKSKKLAHRRLITVQQFLYSEARKGNIKTDEYNWLSEKFHDIHSSINNLDDESMPECVKRMESMGFDTSEIEELEA